MTLGLALIALNEEDTLPNLLATVEGAFDRVVLLDTGSKDRTIEVFQEWATAQPAMTYSVGHFDWVHDFAAARQAADELLGDVDWACWADADDTLHGAQRLRLIAEQAPPEVAAFIASYDYAHDHHGNVVCVLQRERLVRKGYGHWTGRVHEAQLIHGPSQVIDRDTVRWIHHKQIDAQTSNIRNLRILRAWLRDEPQNPRVLGYLGTEEAARGNHKRAIGYYRRYLALKTGWDEERAQIHRKLACSLMALGQHNDAVQTALAALAVVPDWPDSHLSLAEACYSLGEHEKAIKWAREVLRLGQPDSLLILNPLDYHWKPKVVLAAALGALNRVDEALAVARDALELVPDHAELRRHAQGWQSASEREAVAATWVGAAQLLVRSDEQLKALDLLERTVPYFCVDHPSVVAMRSQVRERLLFAIDPGLYAKHYSDGAGKPEALHTDEEALSVAERLPRAHFLARQLAELDEVELQEAA